MKKALKRIIVSFPIAIIYIIYGSADTASRLGDRIIDWADEE